MKLGIVGHGQEKFTPNTEQLARAAIAFAMGKHGATYVVSGRSPMGGVDLYAEEVAAEIGLPTIIYPPTTRSWYGSGGFKERNLQIAAESDLVLVVVVAELPPGFKGMRFGSECYHCLGRNPDHVKSGGCWTAWKARAQEWTII